MNARNAQVESGTPPCIACGSIRPPSVLLKSTQELQPPIPPWQYELLQCRSCGIGRLHPSPEPAVLAVLYSSDYLAYQPPPDNASPTSRMRQLKFAAAMLRAAGWQSRSKARGALLSSVAALSEFLAARSIPLTTSVPFFF